MKTLFLTLVAATALGTAAMETAAMAQSEKEQCLQLVADVKQMRADSTVSERNNQQADILIEVGTSLCERGNYPDAAKTMQVARGLLVTEN